MIFGSYSVLSFFVLTIIKSTTVASTDDPCVEGSTSISPEYEELPRSIQDEVFQQLFRDEDVLLSFMNAVFEEHPEMQIGNITKVDVLPRKSAILVGAAEIEFDVRITDSDHQQYIVEMQQQFRPYQVARFQYYGCAALVDGVKEFYAKFKAKDQNLPYPHELYQHVPKVIVIVFAHQLSVKPFIPSLQRVSKEKKTEYDASSVYSTYCPMDRVGRESKLNLLFIDLERFRRENLETSYDMWIHFMKNTRYGKFNRRLESVYANEAGIVKALSILRGVSLQQREKLDKEWQVKGSARIRGMYEITVRVAKVLFKEDGLTIQEIAEITGFTEEELRQILNCNA